MKRFSRKLLPMGTGIALMSAAAILSITPQAEAKHHSQTAPAPVATAPVPLPPYPSPLPQCYTMPYLGQFLCCCQDPRLERPTMCFLTTDLTACVPAPTISTTAN